VEKASHPPCSPDSILSDVFLFGEMKRQLAGASLDNGDDCIEAIQEILDGIPRATLIRVFEELIMSLEQCIDTGGDDIE
jgi:hypothetical protein